MPVDQKKKVAKVTVNNYFMHMLSFVSRDVSCHILCISRTESKVIFISGQSA